MPENDGSVCFKRYALLGIDVIPHHRESTNSNKDRRPGCQIIECNFFPNISHIVEETGEFFDSDELSC